METTLVFTLKDLIYIGTLIGGVVGVYWRMRVSLLRLHNRVDNCVTKEELHEDQTETAAAIAKVAERLAELKGYVRRGS